MRTERPLQPLQSGDQPAQQLHHAHGRPGLTAAAHLLGGQGRQMTCGRIIKLVVSYGSRWGRIQPDGTSREVFFNRASFLTPVDFDSLREGQAVEFEEEPDRANTTHAIRVIPGELPVLEHAT